MSDLLKRLDFKFMSLTFKVRDKLNPPVEILNEVGIVSGDTVLDFGCGPGSFTIAASGLVGDNGKIYAVDKNPLALETVKKKVEKNDLKNIEPIRTNLETGLMAESADVILFYDTFHAVSDKPGVIKELNRILKDDGILSFSDHHLREKEIIAVLTSDKFFQFTGKGKKTLLFKKNSSDEKSA